MLTIFGIIFLSVVIYIGYKLYQISKTLESLAKFFGDKHDKDTPHLG